MADCCLTGCTREETLVNHVRWLSSWACTMTKKVEELNDIIDAMVVVRTSEARQVIAGGASRLITFVSPADRKEDDAFGLKVLMEQFKRAGEMVKHPESIPFHSCPKNPEPGLPSSDQKPIELGALAQCLRFCMVADTPIPDIELVGKGTVEDLAKMQSIICDSVLLKKAASVNDIATALKEAGYDCQVELTPVGSDMKCGLKIRLEGKETIPASSEEQPIP